MMTGVAVGLTARAETNLVDEASATFGCTFAPLIGPPPPYNSPAFLRIRSPSLIPVRHTGPTIMIINEASTSWKLIIDQRDVKLVQLL